MLATYITWEAVRSTGKNPKPYACVAESFMMGNGMVPKNGPGPQPYTQKLAIRSPTTPKLKARKLKPQTRSYMSLLSFYNPKSHIHSTTNRSPSSESTHTSSSIGKSGADAGISFRFFWGGGEGGGGWVVQWLSLQDFI